MPLELKICLFIAGISIMIAITVRVHRQRQKIYKLYKQQQQKRDFINGIKYGVIGNPGNDRSGMGGVGESCDDQQPKVPE